MNAHNTMPRKNRGFTLIELMVGIAVIALLVALVAVSLKAVRDGARRTRSLNALKQIMLAYRSYSDDNRGQLLPGYIDETLLNDLSIRVVLPDGTVLCNPNTGECLCNGGICDAGSYVWRLAPYLDNAWQAFYTDTNDTGLMAELEADYGAGIYGPFGDPDGGISERPTFGLNSIFVGGDSVHGGTYATDRHPWTGDPDVIPLAATRFTQVKNPARLIVFGAAAKADAGGTIVYDDESLGFCELRAPFLTLNPDQWINPQWLVGTGGLVEQTSTGEYADGAGLPIMRHGNNVLPIGMLDGSTAAESLSNLSRDMRRWSPFEVALRATALDPPPE